LVNLTNEALLAGEMTEKEMNDMFSSMGYTPEVTYVKGPTQENYHQEGAFIIGEGT
jgi:phosphoketolase